MKTTRILAAAVILTGVTLAVAWGESGPEKNTTGPVVTSPIPRPNGGDPMPPPRPKAN